jgi:hypothetical protein
MEESSNERYTVCPTGIRAFNTLGNVVRLPCDQWRCPVCCVHLSRRWARRVRYGIALWPGQARHWVITLPPEIKTSAQGFWLLPKAWNAFRMAIQRSIGEWHYAAFIELHPKRTGIAHVHIVSLQATNGRLKDMAHHAGFGFIASDDLIEGWEAAYYVAKYTSKQGEQMPKGFHRVRLDQQWPVLPEPWNFPLVIPRKAKEPLADYCGTSGPKLRHL